MQWNDTVKQVEMEWEQQIGNESNKQEMRATKFGHSWAENLGNYVCRWRKPITGVKCSFYLET